MIDQYTFIFIAIPIEMQMQLKTMKKNRQEKYKPTITIEFDSVSAMDGDDFRVEYKSLTDCHEFSDTGQSFHLIKYSICPFASIRERSIFSIAWECPSFGAATFVAGFRAIFTMFSSSLDSFINHTWFVVVIFFSVPLM